MVKIRVVFLIGKESEKMIDFWKEGTRKKRRILISKETGKCGFTTVEAAVLKENNEKHRFCFFVIPENRIRAIPKIIGSKINIKPVEAVSVISTRTALSEIDDQNNEKRYNISSDYGWITYYKNSLELRDINEFAAVFFNNEMHPELRRVVKEKGKSLLKNNNLNPFVLDFIGAD